jgi:hypothetical protein
MTNALYGNLANNFCSLYETLLTRRNELCGLELKFRERTERGKLVRSDLVELSMGLPNSVPGLATPLGSIPLISRDDLLKSWPRSMEDWMEPRSLQDTGEHERGRDEGER